MTKNKKGLKKDIKIVVLYAILRTIFCVCKNLKVPKTIRAYLKSALLQKKFCFIEVVVGVLIFTIFLTKRKKFYASPKEM